jgi:site-specific recombinase XerD
MKQPPKLLPVTQRFLRTRPHRRVRLLVYVLHRWLDRQQLTLSELTPAHFRRFLIHPGQNRIATHIQVNYGNLLRVYLKWLYDRGLVSFVPAFRRRRPFALPATAREFLASLAPTRGVATCKRYVWSLRKFHAWLDAHELQIHRLTRFDLAPWFQSLHRSGLHPVSRLHILCDVRVYLVWLATELPVQTAADDLIRRTDIPKLPKRLPRPLTAAADQELQRRLSAAAEPGTWALLLMRRTGLRIGELRNLEYHCVRLDKHHPLLKVPLGKLNNERLVPLDPDAVELIRRLQSVGTRPRSWLVPGFGGARMTYDRIRRILTLHSHGLAEPARVTSHRLRHTYATELLSAGMSLPGVMRLLGHRDHHMTLLYTAITPETVSDEYDKALARLTAKYRLPASSPTATPDPDIEQLLDDVARWLRKHQTSPHSMRALLKRVERLRHDLQTLTRPTRRQP